MEETAGGYPAFAALPATYTEKQKEHTSQHCTSFTQTHMSHDRNLQTIDAGDIPAGDNWTNEMTRTNLIFCKPPRELGELKNAHVK